MYNKFWLSSSSSIFLFLFSIELIDNWPVETILDAITEKLRGERFENESDLRSRVVQDQKIFTTVKCEFMMKKLSNQLKQVTD